MFVAKGTIDESQYWHKESYPWASSIDPIIKRQIRDTSSNIG